MSLSHPIPSTRQVQYSQTRVPLLDRSNRSGLRFAKKQFDGFPRIRSFGNPGTGNCARVVWTTGLPKKRAFYLYFVIKGYFD